MTKTEKNLLLNAGFLLGFQGIRGRSHLFIVIFIHALLWLFLFYLPFLLYPIRITDRGLLMRELINNCLVVALFYLNLYYFMPRLFARRKFFRYFGFLLLGVLLLGAQQIITERLYMESGMGGPIRIEGRGPRTKFVSLPATVQVLPLPTPPVRRIHVRDRLVANAGVASIQEIPDHLIFGMPDMMVFMGIRKSVSSIVMIFLFGGFIHLLLAWLNNEQQKKTLEMEKLNSELSMLKAQINPHFLFNSLNTIYAQAHAGSRDTEHSILKLSHMLHYVIYDTIADKQKLQRELEYLRNYIDLQTLRLSPDVLVRFHTSGPTEGLYIAPMLLIPYIENAFKHGVSYDRPSFIHCDISVYGNELKMTVENSKVFKTQQRDNRLNGGIGQANTQKRLDLMYPNRHTLNITETEKLYRVELTLKLEYDENTYS